MRFELLYQNIADWYLIFPLVVSNSYSKINTIFWQMLLSNFTHIIFAEIIAAADNNNYARCI